MTGITEKRCPRCKQTKALGDFYRCKGRRDGRQGYCKPCSEECRRSSFRSRVYGMSDEEFAARLEAQAHGCAICLGPLVPGKHLHVDHDHRTGQVRGLLCHGCNTSLGGFKDDPEVLERAAAYLRHDGF